MPDVRDTLNLDAVPVSVPTGLFIDGHWRPSASGSTMAVENPAPREVIRLMVNLLFSEDDYGDDGTGSGTSLFGSS
jgi:hypothetical protein